MKPVTAFSGIDRDEFIALTQTVGFTDYGNLARFIGTDRRLARSWFEGEKHVPIPVVMVLELMRHFHLTPQDVEAITGEQQ